MKLEEGVKMIGWFDMAMRFSSKRNKLLFCFAALGTCAFGMVRPGFAFFFGRATNGVGSSSSKSGINMLGQTAIRMVGMGIFGGVT